MTVAGTPTRHDAPLAVDQTVQRLEGLLAPRFPDEQRFDLVSLPLPEFCQAVDELGPAGGRRFLDVGCGIGTKLAVAYFLGWGDLTGIELRADYAATASFVCPEAEVIVADAMEWDGFDAFDVVYMYRPFVDDADQAALEARIVAQARPGTTLVWPQRGGTRVI